MFSMVCGQESVTKALSDVEKTDKDVLKRLFPTVSVSDKLVTSFVFKMTLYQAVQCDSVGVPSSLHSSL